MGLLVDGVWQDQWYDTRSTGGGKKAFKWMNRGSVLTLNQGRHHLECCMDIWYENDLGAVGSAAVDTYGGRSGRHHNFGINSKLTSRISSCDSMIASANRGYSGRARLLIQRERICHCTSRFEGARNLQQFILGGYRACTGH